MLDMNEQVKANSQDLTIQPNVPKTNSKRYFFLMGGIILALLVLVGGYILFNQNRTNSKIANIKSFVDCKKAGYPVLESYPVTCKTPDGKTFTDTAPINSPINKETRTNPVATGNLTTPEFIVNQISDAVKKDPELSPFLAPTSQDSYRNSLWWVSKDGWNIIVDKAASTILRIPDSTVPTNIEPVQTSISKKFQALSTGIMKKNNLSLNALNSSTSETDKKYYDYIQAYEGPNIYCAILTNPDRFGDDSTGGKSVIEMKVNCADDKTYQVAYNQQIPFLKGLNDKNAIVSHLEVKNNVASLALNDRRTGATAFMYKSGNEWKKIIIAQAVPLCDELVKNNVPKEFWVECYDKDNNIQPKGSAWR